MKQSLLGAAILLIMPFTAGANVVISEIMYDAPGTEGSGDHDWVEVFNAGSGSVDLSTYRFFEAGVNHTLKLDRGAALLASGGYAVIANSPGVFITDNPSFSGTLFDSSFNLSSSGESIGIRTPELSDSDAPFTYAPLDSATNNGQALHRSSATAASFAAATPSPGSGSLSVPASGGETGGNEQNTEEVQATTTSSEQPRVSTPVLSYVAPPVPQLFADGGDDRIVIVGADSVFTGRAYNRKQEIVEDVRFSWNFGDATVHEGQRVLHHFDYPGRYAVTLNIANNANAASDRILVVAEAAQLTFAVQPDGSVAIGNLSGRNLDLSRWLVRSFYQEFALPEDSIILTGETLRIPNRTVGFPVGPDTQLAYPNGVVALRAGETTAASNSFPATALEPPRNENVPIIRAPSVRTPPPLSPQSMEPDVESVVDNETGRYLAATTTQTAAVGSIQFSWWWLAALALALSAGGLVIAMKNIKSGEWTIIEETG